MADVKARLNCRCVFYALRAGTVLLEKQGAASALAASTEQAAVRMRVIAPASSVATLARRGWKTAVSRR